MAIRHAARKPIIPMIANGESIPFDVRPIRTIMFDLSEESIKRCQETLGMHLADIKANPVEVDNPVTQALSEEKEYKVFGRSREAWLTDKVWKIISGYTHMISEQSNEFFLRMAKRMIRTCALALSEAGNGTLPLTPVIEGFIFLQLLRTARPRTKVRAVSIYELWWWESPLGEIYLEENRRQIADIDKQVEIIRIFILHEGQVQEQRVKDVISMHCKKGVDVRIAFYEQVEEHLRYSYLIVEQGEDSGNNNIIAVKSQAINPTEPRGPLLIVDEARLEALCEDFEELLLCTRKVTEVYGDICQENT
jgi:hypothetical protein